jgi:hypothetical protein
MKKLTSAKVEEDLLQQFKEESIKYKFSIQKLLDRTIYLYLTDEEFKKRLHSQTNITLPK